MSEIADRLEMVETLHRVAQAVTAQLDLQDVVQTVTDATVQLTGAAFGAFFYNAVDDKGESYLLYTISGVPREKFERFPMPRNTAVFAPTFAGDGTVRIDDVLADHRYGHNAPYHGMPEGHLPVRSYLAVPVIARSGEVLGGLFFGHPETAMFTTLHERVVEGIAGYAAIAIENARLYEEVRRELEARTRVASMLQESLLPPVLPAIPGLDIAARYRAGAEQVGGDFYDVFPLGRSQWAVVIGDVCGHGPDAAALTALARHTIRTASMLEQRPEAVLEVLNRAMLERDDSGETFCSVMLALVQSAPSRVPVTLIDGGHPLAILRRADGTTEMVAVEGSVIGVFPEPEIGAAHFDLRPGDALVLYTDGITESRSSRGFFGDARLLSTIRDADVGAADELAAHVLDASIAWRSDPQDDMAVIVVKRPASALSPTASRVESLDLPADRSAAAAARQWAREVCADQSAESRADVELIVAELVTNAVLHAATEVKLTIGQGPSLVRLEVTDRRADRLPSTVGSGLAGALALGYGEADLDDPLAAEAMTGRGLVLVDATAAAWGVDVEGPYKTVWAELGPEAVLATERGVVSGAGPVDELPGNIRLLAVPARLILGSTTNVDDLLREFQIGAAEGDELGALAAELVAMTGASREPLRQAAIDAVAAGRRLVDARIPATPQLAESLRALVEVLEHLAQLCREGRLLSMAPPDEVPAFRRWLVEEIARQVAGERPAVCPFRVTAEDDQAVRSASEEAALLAPRASDSRRREQELRHLLAELDRTTSVERVAAAVIEAACAGLGAATGSVCAVDKGDLDVRIVYAFGYEDDVRSRWASFKLSDDVPASEAIRTGHPVLYRTRDELLARFPVFSNAPILAVTRASVIMPAGRRAALVVGFVEERGFDEAELAYLEHLANLYRSATARLSS